MVLAGGRKGPLGSMANVIPGRSPGPPCLRSKTASRDWGKARILDSWFYVRDARFAADSAGPYEKQ